MTAAPAHAQDASSFSFLRAPTDQLGVPGLAAGTELTPDMHLFTGYTELAFQVGPRHNSFMGAPRTLEDGRYPIVHASTKAGPVQYSITTFTAQVGTAPVNFIRIGMANTTSKATRAEVTATVRYSGAGRVQRGRQFYYPFRFSRPSGPPDRVFGYYYQPGVEFNPASRYAFTQRALLRDGEVLYDFPPSGGAISISRRAEPKSGDVGPRRIFGRAALRVRLGPRQASQLDFRMPVVPLTLKSPDYARIASASLDAYKRGLIRTWQRIFGRVISIAVPERKVSDTFYTSLVNILTSRYRQADGLWVQTPNKLRYQGFWLRDASVMTNALDLVGLSGAARDNLGFALTWQQPDGLFISQQGQLDGFGQTLWALGQHIARAQDASLATGAYPAVQRAMGWFESARAGDPLGLMPASTPNDNEGISGHITGDNFWAFAGIEQAIKLAQRLGNLQDAQRWNADLNDFARALRTQINAATSRTGGWIPPALDAAGGQDWGNLWAAYPGRALASDDPAVSATLAHVRGKFQEGIATYSDGFFLHGYLAFRLLETELLRGEQSSVVGSLYSELAHTTSTHSGFESGVTPLGSRTIDNSTVPHGWWAAEYVSLLRNMLVREQGNDVVLMSAVPRAWLAPGQTISVSNAPTLAGRVGYTLRGTPTGAQLTWRANLVPAAKLLWQVPAAATSVSATGLSADKRTIALRGATGSLTVRWKLTGPLQTYARTVNGLLRLYGGAAARARTAPPPAGPLSTTG